MRNPEAQQFLATRSGCLGLLTGFIMVGFVAAMIVVTLMAGVWFFLKHP